MIDSKLAGTGNSRFLKSVSNFKTLYPTYDDFVAALIAGTLPIDLNGINPDGWTQQGTPLNKANLLSDDVASGLGLVDDATPNGAFNAIISAKGKSNGFATLDSSGKVPSGQLPSMDYIPTSQKGVANGVASLDSSGKVPSGQLNLSSSVTSTSTTTLANSYAVKQAYDKATESSFSVTEITSASKISENSADWDSARLLIGKAGRYVYCQCDVMFGTLSGSTKVTAEMDFGYCLPVQALGHGPFLAKAFSYDGVDVQIYARSASSSNDMTKLEVDLSFVPSELQFKEVWFDFSYLAQS